MFGGGSRWPFFQLALVLTGFQIAFIGLAIGTHNWGVQPPEILVKMNPLWSKFGQNNVLVPASLFDRMQQASTWRIGDCHFLGHKHGFSVQVHRFINSAT